MEVDAAIRGQLDQELADSTAPPLGSLVADAVTDGRRMRRHRRFATVIGAAAGVLLLVGGGAVVASSLRGTAAGPPETAGQAPPVVTPSAPTPTPPPLPPTGFTAEAVMARLIPMLPAGGTVSDVQATSDEYGSDVSFIYTNGDKHGQIVIGVLAGSDPARLKCHNSKDKTCRSTTTADDVTVRSLMLGKATVRVDAGFPGEIIVFIEADKSVLSRTRAVAIASDQTWLDPPDQTEIDAAAQTVAPLRKSGS